MEQSKIDEIRKALTDNTCFTVKGDFKELYELGYVQAHENSPYYIHDEDNPRYFFNIHDIINEHYAELTEYDFSFYKIMGDEVVELYLSECSKAYGYKGKDREYLLSFKGRYYFNNYKLVPSKKPSIIAYNWYGQKTLTVTLRGQETEWYLTAAQSKSDSFGKFFDSDLYFGLSRVDFDSERKTITDVYFKVGNKFITAVQLAEVVPELKECSYLKLLNWKKYVTEEHISLIEMSLI